MKVTWTVAIAIPGYKGQQVTCRNEKEAGELVLKLFIAGVKRYQIIVDGTYIGNKGLLWIWEALEV